MQRTTRRTFLDQLDTLTKAAVVGHCLPLSTGCNDGRDGREADIALRAVRSKANLLPGPATDVWTVTGEVLNGPPGALLPQPSLALGPTLHLRKGQQVRLTFDNQLSEPTTLHWHGLSVPAEMDGQPHSPIAAGRRFTYTFPVLNGAGTYFYHAHPHERTGEHVYRGMAGALIVHDDEEDALVLPRDEFDVPLVVQDRVFGADNQLVYAPSRMQAMQGWLGDRIAVNGALNYTLNAATRAYRLRIINSSNSRIYRLAWQDGTPLIVMGTDGGLLERPIQREYAMLGPGERLELWADFSARTVGSQLALVSLAFNAGMTMGGMMNTGLPQGAALTIMTVRFDRGSTDRLPLPERLVTIPRYRELDAVNVARPRPIVIGNRMMSWTLNGRTFQLEEAPEDDRIELGALEVWEIDNRGMGGGGMGGGMGGGGMGGMMAMPHPIHVHAAQFQVLSRTGVTHQGYVDEGWKDTLLVMPGEAAKVAIRFNDYTGLYLYHCHILEHEDRGMMLNFRVVP
ncbi:MAG TPA: multicopper oxidase domain-containing protein [Polyangiaceae bacterium]